jgi:hypothetical protein
MGRNLDQARENSMSRRLILGVALVAALAGSRSALAHEGHPHKVMGTVALRHENQMEVKATDGKTRTVTLTDKTRILRGKAKVNPDDIRPGERVVVSAMETKSKDGQTTLVATEIRLPPAGAAPPK